MHKDLKDIWGPQITKSLLENTFCEVARSVKATKASSKTYKDREVTLITDTSVAMKESPKRDLIFYDHKKKCLQNFFRIVSTSKKATALRPLMMMKQSSNWEKESSDWKHSITNWCQNKDDPKMVYWTEYGDKMKLSSKLETSHNFDKLFI